MYPSMSEQCMHSHTHTTCSPQRIPHHRWSTPQHSPARSTHTVQNLNPSSHHGLWRCDYSAPSNAAVLPLSHTAIAAASRPAASSRPPAEQQPHRSRELSTLHPHTVPSPLCNHTPLSCMTLMHVSVHAPQPQQRLRRTATPTGMLTDPPPLRSGRMGDS